MTALALTWRLEPKLALDECLIGVVTLHGADVSLIVSARLNLIEGDLSVTVTSPSGGSVRCGWPWPVDSMPRTVALGPGQRLTASVPLIGTDTSAPVFPTIGPYTLVARYEAQPGVTVTSAPVVVGRTAPSSLARATALQARPVIQSLLSAAAFDDARSGLSALLDARKVATRALAALALDGAGEAATAGVAATASLPERERSSAEFAEAIASVLPGGCFDEDPRRAFLLSSAQGSPERIGLLAATPY